jgi:dipeptidyl aminopeptidase/acylaminoacyl peptidase
MQAHRIALPFVALFAVSSTSLAQQVYTAKDYAQAERWMSYNTAPLVQHTVSGVTYLPDGLVYYRESSPNGTVYMLADPVKLVQAPAFDNETLAAALSEVTKVKIDPRALGVTSYANEPSGFVVTTAGGTFHCDSAADKCTQEPMVGGGKAAKSGRRGKAPVNLSPDHKLEAFIRDNNLWLRTLATGDERPLTTDGVLDYGYATDNAGWQHSDAAILTWSADSKKIATFQQDQRKTGMMYLVPTTNRHPKLEAWRYPLVGDKDVTMIEPVVIDVATAKVTRLKTPPLQHRSMECDDVSCDGDGRWNDVEFSADDSHLAFVSTSRDHKDEYVKVADTATGAVRDVFHDHVDTYYGWQSRTDWKYLPGSDEFLWVSERSNYAQIYLYSLKTGYLKNEVTHGDGPVQDIVRVDEKNRVIYFLAGGKQPGVDPYFDQMYSVGFDGKDQRLLTPEVANHVITAAPDGKTFVDVYSTPVTPQTTVLRDRTGKVLTTLAKQDVSALVAAGWKPATPITVKARDGETPLYGYMETPTNFDAAKKYPVIDYVYPGPQGGSCGARNFSPSHGDSQSLADLGFVVMCLDGMGNPQRSKTYHDAHASRPEDMGDDTIPDQVAGIKDLASQYPYVDATRVGIWGHSGGGNATVSAMFHFPDFFKVGWAESGNHDQREYEDDWDERWAGLEVIGPDGKSNYDEQANQNYAKNLRGRLMLVHGTMDDNVPPQNTLLVVDALTKANKDFDLLMIPNAHHSYGDATAYVTRRRWDYFVKYLGGGVPPENYAMKR